MASPVSDSYSAASGAVIAGGRNYVSPYWRGLPYGWSEIVIPGTKPPSGIVNYSGMALDERGGKIYLHGGGHFDYWGNEVWELDLETRAAWVKHYEPDLSGMNPSYSGTVETDTTLAYAQTLTDNVNWPGAIVVGGVPVRPISRHTYKSVHWIDSLGKMVVGGGSTWSGSGERYWTSPGVWLNSPKDNWLYDPSAKTWDYKGSAVKTPTYATFASVSVYHKGRDLLYQVDKDANSRLIIRRWNPQTNSFVLISGFAAGSISVGRSLCVDTKRDRLIIANRNTGSVELWAYNIDANSWSLMSASGSIPADLSGDAQITYSPVSDRVLLMRSTTAGMSFYDCATGVWSAESVPIPNLVQTEGRWKFDTRRGLALLVYKDASTNIRVFAYKE